MKKILFCLTLLTVSFGLVSCGQTKDEKEYSYAGVTINKNDFNNLQEYEEEARNLYTTITTFNPAKDGNEVINDIVENGNKLKTTINKDLNQKEKKENVQSVLLYENVSIIGIPKNAIKYSREITDTEMGLINQNFKALNDIEASKITTDKKSSEKIINELNDNIGIEVN
ncbi:hypothetical protein LGE21_000064 [Listeria monocytogenes]|nr:hypothetical protein [Listeria monocytogenes]EIG9604839.1 hypothetical protein [Listeria monocytogenes]HAA6420156.1 hypothetical protein [Listeria monocytogenes]HAB7513935.1 hypothetical protein [Listeria monocytogenes]HAC2704466.1 hypothetical protein [Listeria monocytogenes]